MGTRRPIRSGPNRRPLHPKPPRSSNPRRNRRSALSHNRAAVHRQARLCFRPHPSPIAPDAGLERHPAAGPGPVARRGAESARRVRAMGLLRPLRRGPRHSCRDAVPGLGARQGPLSSRCGGCRPPRPVPVRLQAPPREGGFAPRPRPVRHSPQLTQCGTLPGSVSRSFAPPGRPKAARVRP
jgi:hypothetical protein